MVTYPDLCQPAVRRRDQGAEQHWLAHTENRESQALSPPDIVEFIRGVFQKPRPGQVGVYDPPPQVQQRPSYAQKASLSTSAPNIQR